MEQQRARRVSVIIPCYNAENTLGAAFQSLSAQTFTDFEVIVVNDGSTDRTKEAVLRWQQAGSLAIRYFETENRGVSCTRNLGLEQALGEFILFLDADDVYHQDFIRAHLLPMESGADTAFCYSDGDVEALVADQRKVQPQDIRQCSSNEAADIFMFEKKNIHFPGFVFRRALLERHQIRFPEGTLYGEDLEFTWKYLVRSDQCAIIRRRLYGYRDHPDSAVHRINWRKTDLICAMQRAQQYALEADSPIHGKIRDFALPRVVWATAKTFAMGGEKALFRRLASEFLLRESMRRLVRHARDPLIRLTALGYLVNPAIFYLVVYAYLGRKKA